MRLVLLGAPGSGKGTQAEFLKAEYGCAHISTGDILRRNLKDGTALGLEARAFMDRGELAPDDVVVGMVRERLRGGGGEKGFLMDGFPRTLPQAEALGKILEELSLPLDAALLLRVDEELIVHRLTHRRSCRSCGKIWNLLAMPSGAEGEKTPCPECGGELYRRDDDAESVIRNRLLVYHEQTAPLVEWYEKRGKLRIVDAVGSPKEIFTKIGAVLG
ncbi:MAG: adenylate kinase [Synergistaceae bacterium]|jgi:adenylate kinase|nr:adenylate kinase [Synergistaceae bacterium]